MLDEIAAGHPPVDLHRALSIPLSVRVLCELLGVPYADHDQFQTLVHGMADTSDRWRSDTGQAELIGYVSDSVADAIDLGTLLLLANVDQRDAIVHDPGLVNTAVEEILRAADRGGPGLPRYAREDIEIGGVTIRAGEAVLLDTTLANFDDRLFDEPDRFDVTRAPNPHVVFGHGPWHCLGAPLARIELRTVFTSLIHRFPTMRLAVPIERLRGSGAVFTSTLLELPITW